MVSISKLTPPRWQDHVTENTAPNGNASQKIGDSGEIFLKDFTYLFLERGERMEKEREGNIDLREIDRLVASFKPPTGDLACNPGMCPDWESNQ